MPTESPKLHKDRYLAIRNVTLVGVIINIILSFAKLIFGWIGHSQALIADGLHSLSDLLSDGVVLVAAKYSNQHADEEHPYGHARFETVATVAVGLLLIIVAAWILIDAGRRLWSTESLLHPTALSLAITVISILSKEILYHYTMFIAQRVRSQMLRANAWHHRSDAISSVIVLIGILGSMAGVTWLDAIAAIGVSLMIAHIGWSLGLSGLQELVDTGLDNEQIEKIRQIIKSVDGVRTLHDLRTRRMGSNILIEVHILVNPRISVSEGHQIGEMVRSCLIDQMEEVSDVVVHIDPENDAEHSVNISLPLRDEIVARLKQHWQSLEVAREIEQIHLHYLGGKLTVDVYLPLKVIESTAQAQELSRRFIELAAHETQIRTIRLYYH